MLPLLLTPSRLFALCPYPSHPILFLPLAIFQFHYFSFLLFSPTLSITGSSFLLFSRYVFCSTLQPCIFLLCLLLNQFFNLFCLYITSLSPLLFFLLVPSFCLPVPDISSTFISPLFITLSFYLLLFFHLYFIFIHDMCQSLLPLHLSLSFSVILYSLLFPSNAFLSVSSFSLFFTLFLCFSPYGSLPIYVLLLLSICILPHCLPNLDYLLFASLSLPFHHSPNFCLSSSLFPTQLSFPWFL